MIQVLVLEGGLRRVADPVLVARTRHLPVGVDCMRRSGRVFIFLGIALALIAALLVIVVLRGGDDSDDTTSQTTPEAQPQLVTIVVAAREIAAHERLAEEDVREERVDAQTVPAGTVSSRLEVIGYAYADELSPGQPLLRTRLETPGLSHRIGEGMRAYALPVDMVNLVGGLVREDDRLDIIFSTRIDMLRVLPSWPLEAHERIEIDSVTIPEIDEDGNESTGEADLIIPEFGEEIGPVYPYPGEAGSRFWVSDLDAGDPVTKLILQNVRVIRTVLATSSNDEGVIVSGGTLVLEVTPEEAEILRFAVNNGTFHVILRGSDDDGISTTPGLTFNMMMDELGLPAPKTVRLPGEGSE